MKRNKHQLLNEDYPEIYQLWCDAVNAGDNAERLTYEDKHKEAEEMYKRHWELWKEYAFASKLVLIGHKDLQE